MTRSSATSCDDVIKACDASIANHEKYEAVQKTAFDDAMKALVDERVKVDSDESKLSAWYRQWYILVPTTALLTFLTHETIEHSLFR